jgi:hypothetical protein
VAVRLYRNLAAAEPAKYLPVLAECLTCEADWLADLELLADALTAVHEATDICQDKLPWQQVPSCAARAMLLEGDLLCGQARHREAPGCSPRAGAWLLASRTCCGTRRPRSGPPTTPIRTISPPCGKPKPAPSRRTG